MALPDFLAPTLPGLFYGFPVIISVKNVSLPPGPESPSAAASAFCAIYLRESGFPELGGLPPIGVLRTVLFDLGVEGSATSSSFYYD